MGGGGEGRSRTLLRRDCRLKLVLKTSGATGHLASPTLSQRIRQRSAAFTHITNADRATLSVKCFQQGQGVFAAGPQ